MLNYNQIFDYLLNNYTIYLYNIGNIVNYINLKVNNIVAINSTNNVNVMIDLNTLKQFIFINKRRRIIFILPVLNNLNLQFTDKKITIESISYDTSSSDLYGGKLRKKTYNKGE
jgi:hypothetical protein